MPAVTFTVEALSNAAEGGAAGQFRVTANGDAADFTNAAYAVMSLSGTASGATDYTVSPSPSSYLIFQSPGATATVTITAVDDSLVEGTETVGLTVQRYLGYPTGPTASDSLYLYDNDTSPPPPPPPPMPLVSVATAANAVEGGTHGSFRFTRTGDTSASLTVTYTVHSGGTSDATPGDDYEALSGTVTIAAGDSLATVEVVAGIDLIDPGESVTVTITETAEYELGADATAVCTIGEDLTDPATLTRVLNTYYANIKSRLADLTEDLETILNLMTSAASAMDAANAAGNDTAYGLAYGAYGLLDPTMGQRITYVEGKAKEIITAIKEAAKLTEGDPFRIAGLKSLANELEVYLSARLAQVDGLITKLEAIQAAIAGPNAPQPLVTGLEAYLLNLHEASRKLSEQLEDLGSISYTPTNPSNGSDIQALSQVAGQIDTAVAQVKAVVDAGVGALGAIRTQGALILSTPDEQAHDAALTDYALNLVGPLANGEGTATQNPLGLVAKVTQKIDALLDAVEAPDDSDDNGALDLADLGEEAYDVADAFRLQGIIAKLDDAANDLRRLLVALNAARDQLFDIGMQYATAGYYPPTYYWSALVQMNDMISGVALLKPATDAPRGA